MDGGRRKDGEWHSSSGVRSLWNRNAEVKGSKPTSTHPPRSRVINSLTASVDVGPKVNYSSPGGARRTVSSSSLSSALPHGIPSRGMSMEGGSRTDIMAPPNLAGSSYKKDAAAKIDTKTAKRQDRAHRSEVLASQTADSGAVHRKLPGRQDPRSNRGSVADRLDLRKTVNIGARDGYGWQELKGKSGAEEALLYLKKQMAELTSSSRRRCEQAPAAAEEKVRVKLNPAAVERDSAESVAASMGARVKAADMPSSMQIHAFRCARRSFDSLAIFSSKQLAFAIKKEFDEAYGVAWHCIVGTSFGSFVTHSAGGFLYFSIDKLAILLFKTAVERLGPL